jgi:phage terminase small subunit
VVRGRKPKPTALKLLDGTRRDRINESEPAMEPGRVEPPEHLRGIARDHWLELAPMLAKAGLLAVADRPALELLCVTYAVTRDDPLDHKAAANYARLLTEFGMTPSSRSRIKLPGERRKDALGEFLAAKKRAK